MKLNVLICGKTGAGKTSLIQALTDKATVPDSAISDSKPCTRGFQVYETEVVNYIDSEGLEPGSDVEEFIRKLKQEMRQRLVDGENLITTVLYCVDGTGARLQDADIGILNAFPAPISSYLVVTKHDGMRKNQQEAFQELLKARDVEPSRIIYVSGVKETGLERLVQLFGEEYGRSGEKTAMMRKQFNSYFQRKLNKWKRAMEDEADEAVTWAAARAAAIAILPIPLMDMIPLMANETWMIHRLASIYGYSVGESVITMIAGVAGGSFAGKLVASFLPGVKIAVAAGTTYAVGKAAQAYFKSGMKLNKGELEKEFVKGREEAKNTDWKKMKVSDDE